MSATGESQNMLRAMENSDNAKGGVTASLNMSEPALVDKWDKKWNRVKPLVRFECENNKLSINIREKEVFDCDKNSVIFSSICEATGVADFPLAMSLIQEYANVASAKGDVAQFAMDGNSYLNTMKSLNSQDEVEAMLLTQILSLQKLGMACMARAVNPESHPLHVDRNVNNMAKVLRLQHETVDMLNRYRRKGAQQVVVQHVNVNDGGKAIVGGTMVAGGGTKIAGGTP